MAEDFSPSDNTPLAVFSQELSSEQQALFLRRMHDAAKELGIVPVYPVKGGYLGDNAHRLVWGEYNFYDAYAPEFNTIDTIIELLRNNDP